MTKNKGKLIVFEGIDGCGKSTQIDLAIKKLKSEGYKVISTREPGGTPIGEKIRNLLLDKNNKLEKITEAYLFAASRAEHNLFIKDKIEEGYIVICDRHILSSIIYQSSDQYNVLDINTAAMSIFMPNADDVDNRIKLNTIVLDIDYEEYIRRKNIRINTIGLDRMDEEIEKRNIKKILRKYSNPPINAIVVKSEKDLNVTHEKIMQEIYKIIKEEK